MIDIGTNSTRLLVADVGEAGLEEVLRQGVASTKPEGDRDAGGAQGSEGPVFEGPSTGAASTEELEGP